MRVSEQDRLLVQRNVADSRDSTVLEESEEDVRCGTSPFHNAGVGYALFRRSAVTA